MAAAVSNSLSQEQPEMRLSSPSSTAEWGSMRFEKHKGFWVGMRFLSALKLLQMEFQPFPDDIYLASPMKAGTTWIKALVNTILALNLDDAQSIKIPRASVDEKNPHDLVLTLEAFPFFDSIKIPRASVDEKNPHSLVPTLQTLPFLHTKQHDLSILSELPSPRLLHTHLPFDMLSPLVKSRLPDCKIIYLARNPRDVFVSYWKFLNKRVDGLGFSGDHVNGDLSKESVFDAFCSGVFHGGPFAESVLSYWRESRLNPNKLMFLTYEELQADCVGCVKRIGIFLGCSPTLLEEHAQRIVDKCSFDRLSNLEVNKGATLENFNSLFFREGKVGEWKKHFTPEMEERIYREMEQKLNDEGLLFTYS